MAASKEQKLWQACTDGDLKTVEELADDPAVDLNWGDPEFGRTPFYRACGHGKLPVVEYLMRNPRVDVISRQKQGGFPSSWRVRMATARWFHSSWLINELIPAGQGMMGRLPSSWLVSSATRR